MYVMLTCRHTGPFESDLLLFAEFSEDAFERFDDLASVNPRFVEVQPEIELL